MHDRTKGFTLVEMLVATALVVLMMLMFAQIFQVAGGLVSNQKGMAEQDQNVRTLTILLRGDIKSRTFVDIIPFEAGQDTTGNTGPGYVASRRKGFFSISENNPDDSTDDVLHLTITSDALKNSTGGHALPFSGRSSLMFNGTPANRDQYLRDNPDQPEFDDGQFGENRTGSSRYAEVCWFLRNGTLYRRQFLVRDPYSRNTNTGEEPQDNVSIPFIDTTYAGEEHVDTTTNPNGVFWRDFDYSAYADSDNNLKFHSPESLDNLSNATAAPELVGFPRSLGIPFLRYGSSVSRAFQDPNTLAVQIFGPREFLDRSDLSTFIGRFTTEESTHANFAYPGNRTSATDPFNSGLDPAQPGPDLTLSSNGKVNEFEYATDRHQRRGEDIVMSGVHSFDIQVWDDVLNDFANLGHSRTQNIGGAAVEGWYHRNQRANADFGNSYDTWHPYPEMPDSPPYSPFGTNRSDSRTRVDRTTEPNRGLGADGSPFVVGEPARPAEIPLRAIRILIRFHDVGSDQLRDLTFTFPLR